MNVLHHFIIFSSLVLLNQDICEGSVIKRRFKRARLPGFLTASTSTTPQAVFSRKTPRLPGFLTPSTTALPSTIFTSSTLQISTSTNAPTTEKPQMDECDPTRIIFDATTGRPRFCNRFSDDANDGPTSDNKKGTVGEISRKMCKKYSEYVYKKAGSSNSLLPFVSDDNNKKIKDCGFEYVELIVGGKPAKRKEFPHMVAIGYGQEKDIKWSCGGSLISERFVLTAAHCQNHKYLGDASYALMGVTNLDSKSEERAQIAIAQIIPHPDYKPPLKYHDICLMKLSQDVKLSTFIRPACLRTDFHLAEKNVIASGYGRTDYGGPTSLDLLKVTLNLYENSECNGAYQNAQDKVNFPEGIVEDHIICAGHRNETKDTCQGDSGGPLHVYHNATRDGAECMYDIVGVVSTGKGCAVSALLPALYTRVSYYIDWIESNVWK